MWFSLATNSPCRTEESQIYGHLPPLPRLELKEWTLSLLNMCECLFSHTYTCTHMRVTYIQCLPVGLHLIMLLRLASSSSSFCLPSSWKRDLLTPIHLSLKLTKASGFLRRKLRTWFSQRWEINPHYSLMGWFFPK